MNLIFYSFSNTTGHFMDLLLLHLDFGSLCTPHMLNNLATVMKLANFKAFKF